MFPIWFEKYTYQYASPPLMERGIAQQDHFPWRTGKCLFFRIPRTSTALVVGRWTSNQPYEHDEDGPILKFRELKDKDWEGANRVLDED